MCDVAVIDSFVICLVTINVCAIIFHVKLKNTVLEKMQEIKNEFIKLRDETKWKS